jgi:hypothetical protein
VAPQTVGGWEVELSHDARNWDRVYVRPADTKIQRLTSLGYRLSTRQRAELWSEVVAFRMEAGR